MVVAYLRHRRVDIVVEFASVDVAEAVVVVAVHTAAENCIDSSDLAHIDSVLLSVD